MLHAGSCAELKMRRQLQTAKGTTRLSECNREGFLQLAFAERWVVYELSKPNVHGSPTTSAEADSSANKLEK